MVLVADLGRPPWANASASLCSGSAERGLLDFPREMVQPVTMRYNLVFYYISVSNKNVLSTISAGILNYYKNVHRSYTIYVNGSHISGLINL